MEFFLKFFERIKTFYYWIFSPGLLGIKVGGNILILSIFIMYIGVKFFEGTFILKLITLLFFITVTTILWGAAFKTDVFFFIIPRKMLGGSSSSEELLDKFSLSSYLFGITVFSLYLSIFMISMFTLSLVILFDISLNISFEHLFLVTSAIFSFLWFVYHLVYEKVCIDKIKNSINLYLAVSTSITLFFIFPFFEELTKPILTYLGVSYAWLNYLVHKVKICPKSPSNIKKIVNHF